MLKMIIKPFLIIVSGRPGSGKTTFAKKLGAEIFMPVISRDEIKEGYVHSFGRKHSELSEKANKESTDIFFKILMELVNSNISVIAEAAFQHEIWSYYLNRFIDKTKMYLLICKPDEKIALERFINRGLNNPKREYFHGDKGVDLARQGVDLNISKYIEPHLDVPTFYLRRKGHSITLLFQP